MEHAESYTHGCRHAYGRSASDGHVLDVQGYIFIGSTCYVCFFEREPCLIDHYDTLRTPLNGFHHELLEYV
jgi:hypothetical protein